ncbi:MULTISPECIES: substrate-binding domain-containing protein [Paenibacillus]|uniref:substrate-binding domain-containing protein n=1 Tax=Paenibacillus TaxID=44249 RepID=UPI0022B8DFB6|nr:substrate-binding domain-containing protein [Paenibacillus caseinilyticus]MCZ8519203.1 substrate-binding domain-containing protein [Paenibacillus caseinilyticus]
MKKLLWIYALLIGTFILYVVQYHTREVSSSAGGAHEGLRGEIGEKYVMVTFQSGMEYWKSSLKGFEDAAQALNVSVEYRGATQYDVHEQITVLEQVIAKKPEGIALSAMDPNKLTAAINKAVDTGIPVVLFDSGAPESKALSFLSTNNYNAGVTAARKMAELLGGSGETAVVTLPGQQNHEERKRGFVDTLTREFPAIRVVSVQDGRGDRIYSRLAAADILKAFPEVGGIFATEANGAVGVGEAVKEAGGPDGRVKIIGFDTDKDTLDRVKEGTISATLAQGTWNMGYWSLQFLFHRHHGVGEQDGGTPSPLPALPQHVDTGITVVTAENVEQYYAK